eukprot:363957-Chlamydomonas_euryale.AAC.8
MSQLHTCNRHSLPPSSSPPSNARPQPLQVCVQPVGDPPFPPHLQLRLRPLLGRFYLLSGQEACVRCPNSPPPPAAASEAAARPTPAPKAPGGPCGARSRRPRHAAPAARLRHEYVDGLVGEGREKQGGEGAGGEEDADQGMQPTAVLVRVCLWGLTGSLTNRLVGIDRELDQQACGD